MAGVGAGEVIGRNAGARLNDEAVDVQRQVSGGRDLPATADAASQLEGIVSVRAAHGHRCQHRGGVVPRLRRASHVGLQVDGVVVQQGSRTGAGDLSVGHAVGRG